MKSSNTTRIPIVTMSLLLAQLTTCGAQVLARENSAIYLTNGNATAVIRDSEPRGMDTWIVRGQNQLNKPTCGMVALVKSEKEVYLGWRSYAAENAGPGFDLYRSTDGGLRVKLNDKPIRNSTDFVDRTAPLAKSNYWQLAVVRGGNAIEWVDSVSLPSNSRPQSFVSIKLQGEYPFSKVGIADLDGDGKLDFVIKQPQQTSDPGVWQLSTNTFKVEAYRHDGTFLWQNDLGWNIEQGVWWSPMVVADFDGDGKAEVALKTAPMSPVYRNAAGRILDGPEYLSVWNGETGKEIARTDWPARGNIAD